MNQKPLVEKNCECCGNRFTFRQNKRNANRRFCSGFCAKKTNGINNRGKKRTAAYRKALSKKISGSGNPFFGKRHNTETRKLISKALKGRFMGENSYQYMPIKKRLLSRIKILSNGCWEWQSWWRIKRKNGNYGGIKHNGKSILAHRASYEVFVGKIPKDLDVLHKCDNTKCINPKHLFLGTHDDNMKDMAKKGRASVGERSAITPLKEKQVREIRKMGAQMFHREIAAIYGVSTTTIGGIINRKTWKHI